MGLKHLFLTDDGIEQISIRVAITVLDNLLWMDEHLLDANPTLNYAPFKCNNRMLREKLWDSLTPKNQEAHIKNEEKGDLD